MGVKSGGLRRKQVGGGNSTIGGLLDCAHRGRARRLRARNQAADARDGKTDSPGELGLGQAFQVEVSSKLHASFLHHMQQRCKTVVSWGGVDAVIGRMHPRYMPRKSNVSNHPNSISRWRETRGYSIERLAELASTSTATVSRYENGIGDYTRSKMEAIAEALGVEVSELLERNISPAEMEIRDRVRGLPEEEKERVLRILRVLTMTEAG